ncbi:fructokinase [Spiroplasma helicoides]|uniref:Fructokinase n=1 Tax=Spiroplasma helicoides TaxID=216938 RepID=A0A1B3SJC5_9MOLU|nr:carbohydrate kinase [Spiroplasma helicoides]AOG60027.1 fructokinase [Spiroplasma helicoides]
MKKVLCIGESLLDIIVQDNKVLEANVGGAPLNVACTINHLGGQSSLLSSIGDDDNGKNILNTLKKYNVDTDTIQVLKNHKTTVAYVSIFEDGERNFTFELDADQNMEFEVVKDKLKDFSILHFGSATALLGNKSEETYKKLLTESKKLKKFIVFDPNWRNLLWNEDTKTFNKKISEYLESADFIKISDAELEVITGEKDCDRGFEKLIKLYHNATFFITLGPDGCFVGNSEWAKRYDVERAVNPVDTTGAGDAFIGYIIYKISELENRDSWQNKVDEIILEANEYAKKSIYYKGALTFLDN